MEPEEIYGPGVQAEAISTQGGCPTQPGGPSVRARVGARSMPVMWDTHTESRFMPVM